MDRLFIQIWSCVNALFEYSAARRLLARCTPPLSLSQPLDKAQPLILDLLCPRALHRRVTRSARFILSRDCPAKRSTVPCAVAMTISIFRPALLCVRIGTMHVGIIHMPMRTATVPQPVQNSLPARLDRIDLFERLALGLFVAFLLEIAVWQRDLARDSVGVGVTEVFCFNTDWASACSGKTELHWPRFMQRTYRNSTAIVEASLPWQRKSCGAEHAMPGQVYTRPTQSGSGHW